MSRTRVALSALQQRNYLTGTGRYIAELFRALPAARSDMDFSLYVKPDQAEVFSPGDTAGSLRILKGCPSSPLKRVLWELQHFTRTLKRDGVDLYHGPANFLPPGKTCPYVVTLHDMVYFHNPERTFYLRAKYWQYYIRATWRQADLILTDSEFSKEEIQRYLPVPDQKIRVIYIGVDERFFADTPEKTRAEMRASLGLDKPYILYVGRLDPDKNVERIILSYDRLLNSGVKDFDLVISGAKDHQGSRPAEIVRKRGLEERVRFTGYIAEDHLVPLYQSAAAFCFPSLNEGFGLPVLEAMAAGVPVVTSNISSLPEVCGDAGVQVNPRSVRAIAKGLKSILGTQKGAELAQAGRVRAATFTWQRTAEETAQAYEDVLKKHR